MSTSTPPIAARRTPPAAIVACRFVVHALPRIGLLALVAGHAGRAAADDLKLHSRRPIEWRHDLPNWVRTRCQEPLIS
jgi:hypothetical protein